MHFKRLLEVVPDRVLGVLLINGESCPVTNMFDLDGDETSVVEDAYSVVAMAPDGKWLSIIVNEIGIHPLQ